MPRPPAWCSRCRLRAEARSAQAKKPRARCTGLFCCLPAGTYFDRSRRYLDVPLPEPSSAATTEMLARPAACATGRALPPELNTTLADVATLVKRQLLAAPLAERVRSEERRV